MAGMKIVISKGGSKEELGYPLESATVGRVTVITGNIADDLIFVATDSRSSAYRPSEIPKSGLPVEDVCITIEKAKPSRRRIRQETSLQHSH